MTFSKLGTDIDTQQLVYLPKTSRTKGVYILGLQGSGKSGLIENLCVEDGKQGTGFCVIDPHGELIDNVISRLPTNREQDVILFDIRDYQYPFGLNLFTCSDPTNPLVVQEVVDQVMHVFEMLVDVNPTTPQILDYLRNCTNVLVANPGYTMADVTVLLRNRTCREKLLQQVTDASVLSFWHDYFDQLPLKEQLAESISLERRVRHFLQALTLNIVGQSKTSIDFCHVMDEGKIILVKLDSLRLPSVTKLIGALIIALFLNTAPSRTKGNLFNIYADEFPLYATEDFVTLIEQARKRHIGLAMAHQNRGQLDARTSNVASKLRDRTLGTKQKIIFTITGQDADEVAGEFDVSPQAAWEEEIAKEWVEVLKPEWVERKEEDVLDGVEEIQMPVRKFGDWFISGKTHPNPKVNQFFRNYPNYIHKGRRIGLSLRFIALSFLDDFLYQVMHEKNPLLPIPTAAINIPDYYKLSDDRILYILSKPIRSNTNLQQYLDWLRLQLCTSLDIHQMYQACASVFASEQEMYEERLKYYENKREQHRLIKQGIIRGYVDVAYGGDYTKATDQDLQRLALDEVKEIQEAIHEGLYVLEQFFNDLREVMRILAVAPILEGSGIRQPRKRKQINFITHARETLTHPRKVIMHPQRAYQDVKNDIANQLSGLPNFTARVKLDETFPQNPGKKCLSCTLLNNLGAKFCSKCGTKLPTPNEYTIETIKPTGYLGTQQLQQRIQGIQARNRQKLYCRSKKDVEAEILQRQTSCNGAAPAQPQPQQPSPQQQAQARHARQVPVQGHCPTCNATNPRGSKFCNNCGSPL